MREFIAVILILVLATIALVAIALAKPVQPPLVIDAQSPGAWPAYASVPHMPGAQICKPILYSRHPAPTEYVRA